MIEPVLPPITGSVAIGTLTGMMIGWSLKKVAVNAVVEPGVAKPNLIPCVGVVANGALIGVMVFLWCMAILTIRKVRVVKPRVFPVDRVVAIRALPLVMIGRTIIRQVAGLAVGEARVIKSSVLPVGDVGMAMRAGTGIWVKRGPSRSVYVALR